MTRFAFQNGGGFLLQVTSVAFLPCFPPLHYESQSVSPPSIKVKKLPLPIVITALLVSFPTIDYDADFESIAFITEKENCLEVEIG